MSEPRSPATSPGAPQDRRRPAMAVALAALGMTTAVLTVGACAPGSPRLTMAEERAKLEADCAARGGILAPSPTYTGREQLDNFCEIRSGPSERVRRPGG